MSRRLLAAALLVGLAAVAARSDDPRPDPLDALKDAIAEQDRQFDGGRGEAAVAAARERVKAEASAEGYYLLGRVLGVTAERMAGKAVSAEARQQVERIVEEASENFGRSDEAGGLTYAPAHLGLARVAMFRYSIALRDLQDLREEQRAAQAAAAMRHIDVAVKELQQALLISRNFKAAAIELSRALAEKKLESEAESVLYRFLVERPADAEARILLGMFKLRRHRFSEAEAEFRSVVSSDAANTEARRLLAVSLMNQEKFEESAQHWEMVRTAEPKDEESYVMLVRIYRRLKQNDKALGILDDLVRDMPGTEPARLATQMLEQLKADPHAWDAPETVTRESLVRDLDARDPEVVLKALTQMRQFKWSALPRGVYDVLRRTDSPAAHRAAAVKLIGDMGNPQALTIFEVMLFHPTDRDPDSAVRKELAHATAGLASDAIVPILFEALTDPDPDVRESAVQGIAARTGKWFRNDLAVRTPDKDWAAELELYRKWWGSSSASSAKRNAAIALAEMYGKVEKGAKTRVARYALAAMDDPVEATWRAGYELFRALTFRTFGSETDSVEAQERARIAREARAWLDQESGGKR